MSLRVKLIQFLIDINEKLIFYPRLKKFYSGNLLSASPVIVDVGSNKGQTIDFFKQVFPGCKVYSFEPNKKLFDSLVIKYKNDKSIRLFNKGISDVNGVLFLKETVTDLTSTFEELNYESKFLKTKSAILGVRPEKIVKEVHEVEVNTLASFFKKESITHVDVLKIDTEGHEFKCLKGLFSAGFNSTISYIQLEHHFDDMYLDKVSSEEIETFLFQHKFKVDHTVKHGFGDFKEVIYKATV